MIHIVVFLILVGAIVFTDLHLEKRRKVKFKARIKRQHEDIERLSALVSDVSTLLAQKQTLSENKRPNLFSLSSSVRVEAQNIFINVYNPAVLTPEQLTALSGSGKVAALRGEKRPARMVLNYSGAEPFNLEHLTKRFHGLSNKSE